MNTTQKIKKEKRISSSPLFSMQHAVCSIASLWFCNEGRMIWQIVQEREAAFTNISSFYCLFSLRIIQRVLPIYPCLSLRAVLCVMNSSADKADLSFCHEGREGRQTVECSGSESWEGLREHRYASFHIPAVPSIALSLNVTIMIRAMPQKPPATIPVYLHQPSFHQTVHSWNNILLGLTRNPHPLPGTQPNNIQHADQITGKLQNQATTWKRE